MAEILDKALDLVDLLKEETKTLRIQFIEETEKYALANYNQLLESDCNGVAYTVRGEWFAKSLNATRKDLANVRILNSSVDEYISAEVKKAEEHYSDSIVKLALRIAKKNLNIQNLKLVTSHIGVNIETIISDGVNSVTACTIIASGAIQKPHYRYLIK